MSEPTEPTEDDYKRYTRNILDLLCCLPQGTPPADEVAAFAVAFCVVYQRAGLTREQAAEGLGRAWLAAQEITAMLDLLPKADA